jgi:hypothetical protein
MRKDKVWGADGGLPFMIFYVGFGTYHIGIATLSLSFCYNSIIFNFL